MLYHALENSLIALALLVAYLGDYLIMQVYLNCTQKHVIIST